MDLEAIRDGMTVYSADGERLGKVIRRSGDTLLIEKGLFFKKDYLARFDDVERAEDDRLWLRRTREEIEAGPEPEEAEPAEPLRAPDRSSEQASPRTDGARMSAAGFAPNGVVVVVEEEVEIVDAPGRRSHKDPDTRE
jgi:hypothetical protein